MKQQKGVTIGQRYTLMWPRLAPAMRVTGKLVQVDEGDFCTVTVEYAEGKRYKVILDQARWCEAGEHEPNALQVKVKVPR